MRRWRLNSTDSGRSCENCSTSILARSVASLVHSMFFHLVYGNDWQAFLTISMMEKTPMRPAYGWSLT